jgi:NAD(P)-dependent dehydrogenase (short-subunit alcohol dehydrogenase family)
MGDRPVVLVTGAARRLGRAIVQELAAHGFDVAVHYRQSADDAAQTVEGAVNAGVGAQAFAADLGDEDAARRLVPEVVGHFGRLDAVVNNASSFDHDEVASFSYARLEQMMRSNCAPAIVLSQALHAHVRSRAAQGCVINLLDQKLWNPNPDHLSYTLSKAALESATTLLAIALAPALRVCGVAPGLTLESGPMDPAEFERAFRMTPLQRSSTPEDIARTVRFLIESPAITGTTVLVDGGQHLAPQRRDVYFLAREAADRS